MNIKDVFQVIHIKSENKEHRHSNTQTVWIIQEIR